MSVAVHAVNAYLCTYTDINECLFDYLNDCHENSTCNDTEGSYHCTCDVGFSGDGMDCSDVDECITNTAGCDSNAHCVNSIGSYNCYCSPGYSGNGLVCEGKKVVTPDLVPSPPPTHTHIMPAYNSVESDIDMNICDWSIHLHRHQ